MNSKQRTFIICLWLESSPLQSGVSRLRFGVENVVTGECYGFISARALAEYLDEVAAIDREIAILVAEYLAQNGQF